MKLMVMVMVIIITILLLLSLLFCSETRGSQIDSCHLQVLQ